MPGSIHFLEGGGEMGALTRAYDWAQTSVGPIEQWPTSLRTTVSTLLHSRFPMFLWWGSDLVQFYNDAYRPSLGNEGKHPTALGSRGRDSWPEAWGIIEPLVTQVLETGEATWSEDQLVPIYRNGRVEDVYWTFAYSPVTGDSGLIEGVLVICNETTEKVLTVRRLTASENHFDHLIQESPVGIIVLSGPSITVDIVNAAYGRLIDRTPEELLGRKLFEIIPEAESRFRPIIDTVRTTGEPVYLYDYPYFAYQAGKMSEGYANLIYQPFRETDGRITGVMVLCQEITEQVNARKKVLRSEQRFRDLVAEAPIPTAVFTGEDMIVEIANLPMLERWGKDHSVIGHSLFAFLPEIVDQKFPELLRRILVTGETYAEKDARATLLRDGKSETVYVDFIYKPLLDENGRVGSILSMSIDVTDRVLARQKIEESVQARTRELADANLNLQRSNAELSQFAYIASHDLQEPVRKISTYTEMLETNFPELNELSKKYLHSISKASHRMTTLIRDVLAFSELSTATDHFQPVDLQGILEEVKTEYELAIDQKQAVIICDALPVIDAIPLQMTQLFVNLVSNALKYARQHVPPRIVITAEREGESYHFRIADNGIGFDAAYAEQIFSIFKRLHRKTEFSGNGIGLAMSRKIVQNHHGQIYATGIPDTGATFHVILPIRQSE